MSLFGCLVSMTCLPESNGICDLIAIHCRASPQFCLLLLWLCMHGQGVPGDVSKKYMQLLSQLVMPFVSMATGICEGAV